MHVYFSIISLLPITGIRQQQNQRSSFIDGTMIYGFNRAKEDSLRIGEMGKQSFKYHIIIKCYLNLKTDKPNFSKKH